MASHGFSSFTLVLNLRGDGVRQSFEFDGTKCAEHEDIADYIASVMRPRLSALSPQEKQNLLTQIAKLEATVAKYERAQVDLTAQNKQAKKEAENLRKAVIKGEL